MAFEAVKDLFQEPPDTETSRVYREQLIERHIVLWLPEPFNKPVRQFTLILEGGRARFKIDEELP